MNAYKQHKRKTIGAALLLLAALLTTGLAVPQPHALATSPFPETNFFEKSEGSDGVQSIRYAPDDSDFPNPERGFHRNTELIGAQNLTWVREQGYALVRAYVRMDAFRDRPFTREYLDKLRAGFAAVRTAQIKVLPVFAYNFPTDEDIKADRVKRSPDAPLPLVLQHLRQLKPVLAENQDVIAALEIGFVGAWGEWHSSANGLDSPQNKQIIHQAILNALPKSRMMQMRYPADLMNIYPVPLSAKQAYGGSDQARTGWANMCFLSNASDSGTYWPLDTKVEKQRYMEQMTPYVVVGGETCQITPEQSRADCPTALAEFARFHFSYLNLDFYQPTIAKWKQDGCFATISRRMGYRFRLLQATVPRQARLGQPLNVHFTVVNDGWATPYNPRRVELVLRHKEDGQMYRFPLRTDPRRWFANGATYKIDASAMLPANAPTGNYEVLLNLPDPMPTLAARPEYSIRLANHNVWEPQTGFNHMQANIAVSR